MSTLADRYHPPSRVGRWLVVGVVALVGAIGLAWLGWAAWWHANPPVAGQITAFRVQGENEVTATLAVDRTEPGRPATCWVFAQAVSYERVGELKVDIPAGTTRLVDVPVVIRTFKRATSVSLDRCAQAGG